MGPARVHVINHPRLVREVVVDRAEEFEKSPLLKDVFGRIAGNGVICSDGEYQKKQRKLIMPALHYKRVSAYCTAMAEGAEQAAERWRGLQECEIGHEMFQIAFGAMARALFGAESAELRDTIYAAMNDVQETLKVLFASPIPVPKWIPTPTNRRLRRAVDGVDAIVSRLIAEKRALHTDTGDFLSMLVLGEEGTGSGMSDREVLDEAKTLFLAGFETTVYLLLWTWFVLSEHPPVEARLHAELARVLGGRTPTAEDVKHLQVTRCILDEVIRLYPPVWAFNRASTRDTKVDGYMMKRGQLILICPYLLQRDARFFDRPEIFNPDRFGQPPDKYAYIPFGIGPRSCIGAQFAMTEATIILATLAQRYQLSALPGQDTQPVAFASLRPRSDIRMRIRPRAAGEDRAELSDPPLGRREATSFFAVAPARPPK
jgi:cytochrome P450